MSTAVIGYMPMPVNFEYRSLFLHGRPKHEKYDDFWRKHPPMDTVHRAKIFSAFDALTGFGDCIASKEVQYSDRRHLSEEKHENLDKKLSVLRRLTRNSREVRRNMPQISVEYFSPCTDRNSFAYGTGGIYETVSGICRKIDDISDTITVGETVIPIDDISLLVSVSFALIYVRSLSCLESIWHSSFTHPVQQRRGSCLSQPPLKYHSLL